jgi:hypothetical protein
MIGAKINNSSRRYLKFPLSFPYPSPLDRREAVKKIKMRKGKASLVARGRGKLTPPKPGGR